MTELVVLTDDDRWALTCAVFALNTLECPEASDPDDVARVDTEAAIARLVALRDRR